jgi:hypothetical protein
MQKPHEYITEFLYFVIRRDTKRGKDTLLYCSGVNIDRFLPITRGRHRPMSNPAIRGLQLVNLGVRDMALSQGAVPKTVRGNDCAGIAPTRDDWYKELLLIENAPEEFPETMISYCVVELLKKFDKAIMLGARMPETLLKPDELQVFLESLCARYGREKW